MAVRECESLARGKWCEGVVLVESQGKIANHVFELSHPVHEKLGIYETVVLPRFAFRKCQPRYGRFKNSIAFPEGTRLNYQRIGNTIYNYKVLGSMNFNLIRAVRGVYENEAVVYIDMLDLILDLGWMGIHVVPGVAFQCSLIFDLHDTVMTRLNGSKRIEWNLLSVDRISYESILFDNCPWQKRGVITLQTEPDYNRKFEAVTFLPRTLLVYLGAFRFLSHRPEMPFVLLGPHSNVIKLVPGRFYVTNLIPSRLCNNVFTGIMLRLPRVKDREYFQTNLLKMYKLATRISPYREQFYRFVPF